MLLLYSGQAVGRTADAVDNVMLYIIGISVVLLLGITAAMIYFVFKYNRKKGHKPVDIHGNVLLEVIWIGIPFILVMSMFYFSFLGFQEIRNIPDDAFEVDVTARMWDWTFDYPNGKSDDTLYVPAGTPVKLNLKSRDVNHALFIPALRIKEDAVPGYTNYLMVNADKPGRYEIACAEYCGLKHSMMYTQLVVLEAEEFTEWYGEDINAKKTDVNKDMAAIAEAGILDDKGCLVCHSTDGEQLAAPTFKGIYGRQTFVSINGKKKELIADINYLRRSILNPDKELVLGYEGGQMALEDFDLTNDEIEEIVQILKVIN